MPFLAPKDIGFHLGVPSFGLMTEMNAGLQEFLHRNVRHVFLLFSWFFLRFYPPRLRLPWKNFHLKHRETGPKACDIHALLLNSDL